MSTMFAIIKSFWRQGDDTDTSQQAQLKIFKPTPTDRAFARFENSKQNPFINARKRLKVLVNHIRQHAHARDRIAFTQTLELMLSELTIFNSNISRFVVTPSKRRFLDEGNKTQYQQIDTLFRQHNAIYVCLRSQCKMLLLNYAFSKPIAADNAMWKSVQEIQKVFSELERLWLEIGRHERRIYHTPITEKEAQV